MLVVFDNMKVTLSDPVAHGFHYVLVTYFFTGLRTSQSLLSDLLSGTVSLLRMVQLDIKTDIEFDFEAFVQKELLPVIEKGGSGLNTFGLASSFGKGSDPKRRTVVCRHWLIGLCQKVCQQL